MSRLGLGEQLRVLLYSRGSESYIGEFPAERITGAGQFTKVLNDTAQADFTIQGPFEDGPLCRFMEQVRTWGSDLVVLRDGEVEFMGPVTNRQDTPFGNVVITAQDPSGWWDRTLAVPATFVEEDTTSIFQSMHLEAFRSDPVLSDSFSLFVSPSDVLSSREVLEDERAFVGSKLRELGENDVNWTALGYNIIVGGDDLGGDPINLGVDDWVTPPSFTESGIDRATHVIVTGADDLVAEAEDEEYIEFYGRITRVFSEPEILDQSSLNRAAQFRLNALKDPVFIDSGSQARLKPDVRIPLSEFVPGTRITLGELPLCRETNFSYRLLSVTTDVEGSVSLSFESLANF